MSKKIGLYTLGCKLNYSETSSIGKQFLNHGFKVVDFKEPADVYLINTCTVTENANRECRQIIRSALRNNPDASIIVTGCYAQLKPEEIASIEGVDYVLGSKEKFEIFSLIDRIEKQKLTEIIVSDTEKLNQSFGVAYSNEADNRTRAFFKIQDGCDYKCSFCTIPLARGNSRSLDPEQVLIQFREIINKNYKEVILTGVNVGDYGFKTGYNLYNLLLKMVEVEGEYRIRISSIEPNLLNDDIIDLVTSNPKICDHFHIPLQSGSDRILSLMKRRYKKELYHSLISKLKSKIACCGIGVDVIVGFPGETYEDFLETYDFIKELPISYLHVFTYSARENTTALEINEKVEKNEKKLRNNMLRILSEKKRFEFQNTIVGRTTNVIFEENNINNMMKGYSSNYLRIIHEYNPLLLNSIIPIKIREVDGEFCKGDLIGEKKSVEKLFV